MEVPPGRQLPLSAPTYGPTDITLHSHQAKRRQGFLWFRRNRHLALINPVDHPDTNKPMGWFAPGFPKKLAVGEGATVYFPANASKRWVEECDLYYFGFNDTFGRLALVLTGQARRSSARMSWRISAPLTRIGRGRSTRSRQARRKVGIRRWHLPQSEPRRSKLGFAARPKGPSLNNRIIHLAASVRWYSSIRRGRRRVGC